MPNPSQLPFKQAIDYFEGISTKDFAAEFGKIADSYVPKWLEGNITPIR